MITVAAGHKDADRTAIPHASEFFNGITAKEPVGNTAGIASRQAFGKAAVVSVEH